MGTDPRNPDQPERFQIFLCYRREDTSAYAGRLYDWLMRGVGDKPAFSKDQIFIDIRALKPGEDFPKAIRDEVMHCDVLLALMGRQWVDAKDANGRRRLESSADYVRLEIEAALERDIPVVPVLVAGAQMPVADELPESLAELTHKQTVELSDTRWEHDVGQLVIWLKTLESEKTGRNERIAPPQRPTPSAARWSTPEEGNRELPQSRWRAFVESHERGDVVEGRVVAVSAQGGFVEVAPGVFATLPGVGLRWWGDLQHESAARGDGDPKVRVRIVKVRVRSREVIVAQVD